MEGSVDPLSVRHVQLLGKCPTHVWPVGSSRTECGQAAYAGVVVGPPATCLRCERIVERRRDR